jgi:hypothetical protein
LTALGSIDTLAFEFMVATFGRALISVLWGENSKRDAEAIILTIAAFGVNRCMSRTRE